MAWISPRAKISGHRMTAYELRQVQAFEQFQLTKEDVPGVTDIGELPSNVTSVVMCANTSRVCLASPAQLPSSFGGIC